MVEDMWFQISEKPQTAKYRRWKNRAEQARKRAERHESRRNRALMGAVISAFRVRKSPQNIKLWKSVRKDAKKAMSSHILAKLSRQEEEVAKKMAAKTKTEDYVLTPIPAPASIPQVPVNEARVRHHIERQINEHLGREGRDRIFDHVDVLNEGSRTA